MNTRAGQAQEMLEGMLNAVDAAVYAFDAERCILWANDAAVRLNVGKAGEKIGAGQKNHFEDNQYFDEYGARLLIPEGESMIDRAFKGEATRDLILEHRNIRHGRHRWLRVSCIPILFEDGRFKYGIIVHQDISAAKNKENKLRFLMEAEKVLALQEDLRDRLRRKAVLMVPSLADWCAIDIKHPDDTVERVVLVHRDPTKVAWLEEFDRNTLKPEGERLAEIVIRTGVPIFMPSVDPDDTEATAVFTPLQIERIRTMQLSSNIIMPITSSREVLGSLAISYAESRRHYSEEDFIFFREFCAHLGVLLENERLYTEINERDRAKDAFLASLSHELRNPLAPIKSSLELIRLQENGNVSEELGIIEHQFDHMSRLLNDLLDTSRLSKGKIQLEMTNFDISTAARSVVRSVASLALDAGIVLEASYPTEALMVFADRTRIEQTITNLLNNAIKFTPQGGAIRLSIGKEGASAVLSVKDTGRGITKEEMRHIFEPYYQSERLRAANSGLGVGLNLAQKIIQLHGGDISVMSEALNKGSEFRFSLPLAQHVHVREKDRDRG